MLALARNDGTRCCGLAREDGPNGLAPYREPAGRFVPEVTRLDAKAPMDESLVDVDVDDDVDVS